MLVFHALFCIGATHAVVFEDVGMLQRKDQFQLESLDLKNDLHRKKIGVVSDHGATQLSKITLGKKVSDMSDSERFDALDKIKDKITCPWCKALVVGFGLDVPVLENNGLVTKEDFRLAAKNNAGTDFVQQFQDSFFKTSKHHHACPGVGEFGTINLLEMDQNLTLEHPWSTGITDAHGLPSAARLNILLADHANIGIMELVEAHFAFYGKRFHQKEDIDTADVTGESTFAGVSFPDPMIAWAQLLDAFGTTTHVCPEPVIGALAKAMTLSGYDPEAAKAKALTCLTRSLPRKDFEALVMDGTTPAGWAEREPKTWDRAATNGGLVASLNLSTWANPPEPRLGGTLVSAALMLMGKPGSEEGKGTFATCVMDETPWSKVFNPEIL